MRFLKLLSNENYQIFYENYGRNFIKVILNEAFLPLVKSYRENFLNRNSKKIIGNNQRFVFFPLQYDPERTISINAPFHTNQLNIITNIAKSLPVDYLLYVKEHPDMKLRGWRKIFFYKEILELPNVTLIHPSVKSDEILKKCLLVITITGTSGFDVLFYGKPSIVFSDVSYSYLPFVYRVKNIEELPQLIRTVLKTKVEPSKLNEYINLIDQNSFEFNFTNLQNKILLTFYRKGFLVATRVPMKELNSFLEENRKEFEILASEHIKKIQQHKDNKLKKGKH